MTCFAGQSSPLYKVQIFLALAVCFSSTPWQSAAGLNLYHCEMPSGELLFSDLPCPPASTTQRVVRDTHHVIEEKTRSVIAQQHQSKPPTSRTPLTTRTFERANHVRNSLSVRNEKCREARMNLAQLRTHRRQGYGVAEARKLDEQEAVYHRQRRINC